MSTIEEGRFSRQGLPYALPVHPAAHMPETPEQRARLAIDANLKAAGSIVQDRDDLDLTAGRGIAVPEFTMKPGFGNAEHSS
jgi:hypothetical protein